MKNFRRPFQDVILMAEAVFEMPVKTGAPRGVGGLTDEVRSARFSTAVGLVLYGLEREGRRLPRRVAGGRPRRNGRNGLHRMRNWFKAVVNQF